MDGISWKDWLAIKLVEWIERLPVERVRHYERETADAKRRTAELELLILTTGTRNRELLAGWLLTRFKERELYAQRRLEFWTEQLMWIRRERQAWAKWLAFRRTRP